MHTEFLKKTVKVYKMSKYHLILILDLRYLGINHQEGVINRVCHQFRYKVNFKNKKPADRCLLQWVNLLEDTRQPILEEAPQLVCMYKFLLRNQKLFFSKSKSKCESVIYRHELMSLIHLRKKTKMEIWSNWFKKHWAMIFSLFIRREERAHPSSKSVPQESTELTSNTKLTL